MANEPSIFDGAKKMYCTDETRISVRPPTKRHETVAKASGKLRNLYPRNISLCCKGVESDAWGFPEAESNRLLEYLDRRPQKILFFDVDYKGNYELIGEISGERWKELHNNLTKWERSGQYLVEKADLDANDSEARDV